MQPKYTDKTKKIRDQTPNSITYENSIKPNNQKRNHTQIMCYLQSQSLLDEFGAKILYGSRLPFHDLHKISLCIRPRSNVHSESIQIIYRVL